MRNFGVLVFLAVAILTQTGADSKLDQCGFAGNIHDCECAGRTSKIRQLDIATCDGKKGTKGYDDCVRDALKDHNHCAIAERPTQWDEEGADRPEGDNAKTSLGSYCKRACAPHRCSCTEQHCDFK